MASASSVSAASPMGFPSFAAFPSASAVGSGDDEVVDVTPLADKEEPAMADAREASNDQSVPRGSVSQSMADGGGFASFGAMPLPRPPPLRCTVLSSSPTWSAFGEGEGGGFPGTTLVGSVPAVAASSLSSSWTAFGDAAVADVGTASAVAPVIESGFFSEEASVGRGEGSLERGEDPFPVGVDAATAIGATVAGVVGGLVAMEERGVVLEVAPATEEVAAPALRVEEASAAGGEEITGGGVEDVRLAADGCKDGGSALLEGRIASGSSVASETTLLAEGREVVDNAGGGVVLAVATEGGSGLPGPIEEGPAVAQEDGGERGGVLGDAAAGRSSDAAGDDADMRLIALEQRGRDDGDASSEAVGAEQQQHQQQQRQHQPRPTVSNWCRFLVGSQIGGLSRECIVQRGHPDARRYVVHQQRWQSNAD